MHDSVEGILNSKYGLSVAREFTMGRATKELGETDLYIYKESDGIITDYAILENKYILTGIIKASINAVIIIIIYPKVLPERSL